jgi:uncharacterized protein (TIGR02588 family)
MSQQDQKPQQTSGSHPLELALGGLGGARRGVLVFLVYQAVGVRDRGPQLRAEAVVVESGQAGSEEHVVRYEVRNDGGLTPEGVRVVGELTRNGRTVETVSSTIAYVPVESRRAARWCSARTRGRAS